MSQVSVVACESYEYEKVKGALREALDAVGGLDGEEKLPFHRYKAIAGKIPSEIGRGDDRYRGGMDLLG